MIDVYDGCNIIYRALSDTSLHAKNGMNIRYRYNALKASDIWVFDGHGHNKRRQAIYPAYKMQRHATPLNVAAQMKLFKELIKLSPATLIEAEGWEADDLIGTLARRGVPMRIHTSDMDYVQLLKLPNVTLNGVKTKDINPRWLPLYKALVGDPSDNIAGLPGFGPKAWDDLQRHLERFESAVQLGRVEGFTTFPLSPRVTTWLSLPENISTLQNMLLITHFFPVPLEEIEAGMTRGVHDPAAAEALLMRYLL